MKTKSDMEKIRKQLTKDKVKLEQLKESIKSKEKILRDNKIVKK
jgi:hypothetical protein